ncbi:MAG: hypothetical protein ACOYT8_01925 [Candidatus Dependentiae bacterium]
MIFIVLFFLILLGTNIGFCVELTILTQDPHKGVFRSLQNGLQQHKITYNINPVRAEDVYPVVLVIDGLDKFRYGVHLKKLGHIKLLLAGPNLMIRSCDYNHLLASPELDHYLVPSEWTKIAYIEDEPSLADHISIWPSGVDIHYWQPNLAPKQKKALIYWKTESESFCKSIEDMVQAKGYMTTRITYGAYSQEQFKSELNECEFAIFVSRSESQGIALAEAWAMNVPTFVWNPGEFFYAGKHYNPVSSCPFLTDMQGRDWKTTSQLEKLIQAYQNNKFIFSPRDWVLKNMSDYASIECLLKIINQLQVSKN